MEEKNLKQILLSMGEDLAVQLVDSALIPYLEEYVKKTDNKVDDIVLQFLKQFKEDLKQLLDKIDGEDDF